MTAAITGASVSVRAEDRFSRRRSVSDGFPYPTVSDPAPHGATIREATDSPEVTWAQLTISYGNPAPAGTRNGYIAPPRSPPARVSWPAPAV